MRMRTRAFTLIEMVIVLLIIGILAVVAIADFSNSARSSRLQAAAFKLRSDIVYARSLALSQQVNCGVVFDPAGGAYSVYKQTVGNIVTNPLTLAPFTVDYDTDSNFQGVVLVSTSFGSPTTNRVEFDSFGTPSDGASPLSADGTVTLSYQGTTAAVVTVTKNTGKVN